MRTPERGSVIREGGVLTGDVDFIPEFQCQSGVPTWAKGGFHLDSPCNGHTLWKLKWMWSKSPNNNGSNVFTWS